MISPLSTTLIAVLLLIHPHYGLGSEITWPNGGFEIDEDRDGIPDFWRFSGPTIAYATSPGTARTGTAAVKLCERGLTGAVAVPGEGFYTAGGHFRGEKGGETVSLAHNSAKTLSGFTPSTAAVVDASSYSSLTVTGKFVPTLLKRVVFDLFTKPGDWVYADDFFIVRNSIGNPGFENGLDDWTCSGNVTVGRAQISNSVAQLEGPSCLSQQLSAEPYGASFVACRVRSEGLEKAALSLGYNDPIGRPLVSASTETSASTDWSTLSLSLVLPATAALGVVTVAHSAPGAIEIDDFRHCAVVTPYKRFSPNSDTIHDILPVTVWTDRDATATISIKDSLGKVWKILHSGVLEGEKFWEGEWDGTSSDGSAVPDGDFEISVHLDDPIHGPLSFKHSVSLGRDPKAASHIPPLRDDFFPRGYWLVVHQSYRPNGPPVSASEVEAEYDTLFSRMAEHHGNVAVPAVLDLQYAAVRSAAERNGIQQIPSFFLPELLMRYSDPLEELDLWARFREAVEPWKDSSVFFAAYPLDEPIPSLFERVRNGDLMLATLAPEAPAVHSFADIGELEDFVKLNSPPVVSFHNYPFVPDTIPGDTGDFLEEMERAAAIAREHNLPFWAVLQSFQIPGSFRMPSPEEFRLCAHLALALGAKGLFSFLFNSSATGALEGLVDTNMKARPLLEEVSQVYSWVERHEGILLGLWMVESPVSISEPGFVRTHVNSEGQVYLFVVNRNATVRQSLRLGFGTASGEVKGITEVASGNSLVLEGGDAGSRRVKLDLPPGGIALLRADGWIEPDLPSPPSKMTPGSIFSKVKQTARRTVKPYSGDFDWKHIGRIYRLDEP